MPTNKPTTEAAETAIVARPLTRSEIMIAADTDVSHLSLEERVELFQRLSEAQASETIPDKFLNVDFKVTNMTVYQRDFVNPDDGNVQLANYVSFTVNDGEMFRTASSQALPFALQTARLIGYDPKTGELPHPIMLHIKPQKAETGFIYRFVFKGLAK